MLGKRPTKFLAALKYSMCVNIRMCMRVKQLYDMKKKKKREKSNSVRFWGKL